MNNNKNHKRLAHWQLIALYLCCYDIVAVAGAYFLALLLRFDFMYSMIPSNYLNAYLKFIPGYILFTLVVFNILRLYKFIWRFVSVPELTRIVIANMITSLLHAVIITLTVARMPISYYIVGAFVQFILTGGIRFSYRLFLALVKSRTKIVVETVGPRIMVIGAGSAGTLLIKDIAKSEETRGRAVCIIDDNPNKWDRFIEGVPVVGGRDDILANVEKYHCDKIYVAIPTATAQQKRDIVNICKESGCELKIVPGIYQIVNDEVTVSRLRDVNIEDLLGRDQIVTDLSGITRHLEGRVVLVTGGGGSIGSELCRQIAKRHPARLIIFDVYENNAYAIEQELRMEMPDLDLVTLIGSVRDSRRLEMVFRTYRPSIVYHAAAHKHVPLMETSPCEAIKNNSIGTYKTAYAAMKYGVETFVLISTDKAVNPTNIMGASKRLCEMIIQTMDRIGRDGREYILPFVHAHRDGMPDSEERERLRAHESHTTFVAVRFGNVLGSNGSVIPLFKKQIAKGGPVTVTHPDIIRYFMTIPEAVSLVLQAGAYGDDTRQSRIYILDMGEPVRIADLARNLIKLSGYKPDVDIKIEYTGLRPGEKLYEEKLMEEEGLEKTPNDLIHIAKPIPVDEAVFLGQLEELAKAAYNNSDRIVDMVAEMVPTFHPTRRASDLAGTVVLSDRDIPVRRDRRVMPEVEKADNQ